MPSMQNNPKPCNDDGAIRYIVLFTKKYMFSWGRSLTTHFFTRCFYLKIPSMYSIVSSSKEHDPFPLRKNSMCLLNFLLIFLHLVDLSLVYLLDVSLSSSLPKIPSLEEDRCEKYLFGSTYTMAGKQFGKNIAKYQQKTWKELYAWDNVDIIILNTIYRLVIHYNVNIIILNTIYRLVL